MTKKIIAATLLCFMIFSGVLADNKSASQRMSEMKTKMAETEKERKAAEQKKEYYDKQIEQLQTDIDELDAIIGQIESEIADAQERIDEATERLETKKENYNSRLRALQKRGNANFFTVLLGADNFSDFLVRLTLVEKVVNHDENIMNEISALRSEIEESKEALEKRSAEQQEAQDLVIAQQNQLQSLADKQQSYMDELKKDAAKFKAEFEKAQRQMEEENERNRRLNESRDASGKTIIYNSNSATKMQWPVPAGGVITCHFGYRTDPAPGNHTGMDIALPTGNAIVAANDGTVTFAAYSSNGYGNYVDINHGDGSATRYAHCSKLYVKVGQKVKRGETIAAVGNTGWSTGPHLHFEVIINGKRVNPLPYIR